MHHRHAVMQHVFSQNIFTLGGPAQDALVLVCYEGLTPLITRYSFSVTNQHQAHHYSARHLTSSTTKQTGGPTTSSVSPQGRASWTREVAKSLGHTVGMQTGHGTPDSLDETAHTSNILE